MNSNRTKPASWAAALAGGATFGVLTWLFGDMGVGYAVLTGAVHHDLART